MKINELDRAKELLSQALGVASAHLGDSEAANKAKHHMTHALRNLEEERSQKRKSQLRKRTEASGTQGESWWQGIVAGTAAAAQAGTAESRKRSLEQLNQMEREEASRLEELEKSGIDNRDSGGHELLNE